MIYRENGQFKTSYRADQQVFPIAQDRVFLALLLVFAYVLALAFLLVRPQGLFGDKIIDRV